MSAPATHDPLVVNTKGGVVWTLRAVSEDGSGWYAPEAVCSCPRFLLTPLSELAALGITGSADVLPVPAGPEPRDVEDELAGANLSLWEEVQAYARLRLALESAKRGRRELRARVAELEAERHSTNESLSKAAEALRADRDRIVELEKRPSQADVAKWLRKKARETSTEPERREDAATAIARLADKVSRGAIRPAAAVESYADKLTRLLAPTQALREDDEFGLRHSYRVSRDLPDAVAESVAEDRSWGGS